jgi:hypothetical protein
MRMNLHDAKRDKVRQVPTVLQRKTEFFKSRILQINVFVLRHRQTFRCRMTSSSDHEETTMPALAEVTSSSSPHPAPRGRDLPTCAVCSDSMIAAEASSFSEEIVSYLWTCENCGYGFVTKHAMKSFFCN